MEDIIELFLVFSLTTVCIMFSQIVLNLIKIRKLRKKKSRIIDVRNYIHYVVKNKPECLDMMDVDAMIDSNKPLEDEYWLPKEYLDEKNRFGFE